MDDLKATRCASTSVGSVDANCAYTLQEVLHEDRALSLGIAWGGRVVLFSLSHPSETQPGVQLDGRGVAFPDLERDGIDLTGAAIRRVALKIYDEVPPQASALAPGGHPEPQKLDLVAQRPREEVPSHGRPVPIIVGSRDGDPRESVRGRARDVLQAPGLGTEALPLQSVDGLQRFGRGKRRRRPYAREGGRARIGATRG